MADLVMDVSVESEESSDCVCCQERLTTTASLTECCFLPVCVSCSAIGLTDGGHNHQSFTCPNCSALTKITGTAILAWFAEQLAQTKASHQELVKKYDQQLQLNQQYYQDHLVDVVSIRNSFQSAFDFPAVPTVKLTQFQDHLTQLSQATIKTLTDNNNLTIRKQLARISQVLDYLTGTYFGGQPSLKHFDQLLLIQQRLVSLPKPTNYLVPKLTLVNHRYGFSVYFDDFKTKLNHCRAKQLNLPVKAPLRTINLPDSATWLDLIGVSHQNHFSSENPTISLMEWPQPGHFSYLFYWASMKTWLAVTADPGVPVTWSAESVRYPEKPSDYHSVTMTPFWLIWLDTKTNRIFYHRGLQGSGGNRIITGRTSPAKMIDMAICQDVKGTTNSECYILDDDYLYINTNNGLWRKYLLDDSAPVWFSDLTQVRHFHYGSYHSVVSSQRDTSVIGRISWDGRVLSQETVREIETVHFCNSNIWSVRYKVQRGNIQFINLGGGSTGGAGGDAGKFWWPGKDIRQAGYIDLTTRGDIMVLDDHNNIVFY